MNFKRKIDEVRYLTVENSERYRAIMKCMFDSFNGMRYWLYKEDILDMLKSYRGFDEYTIEHLKSDLESLLGWKNLLADADTKNVNSITAFKNREFKYQISKNSIEIERMLATLENLEVESGSQLSSNFIVRFVGLLEKYSSVKNGTPREIYEWWDDLKAAYIILNNNYTSFISQFSSEKIDEIIRIEEFLIFKEKFLSYLNDFIKEVQLNYSEIASILENEILADKDGLLEIIYEYEMGIPGTKRADREEYMKVNFHRLKSMAGWFIEKGGKRPLIRTLLDNTGEIINRIIKYAMKIYDERSVSYRKDEYLSLIEKFQNCSNIREAHELSSQIFGIAGSIHVKGIGERETENINSSAYEESPTRVLLTVGRRGASSVVVKNPIRMNTEAKLQKIKAVTEQRKMEKARLIDFAKSYTLELRKLPVLTPEERRLILKNISRKTLLSEEKIIIRCSDGDIEMPDFKIEIEGE